MKLYSVLLSTLLCTSVFALDSEMLALNDTKLYSLEELMNMTIISSTGTEVKISDAPSIATVITAQQIEKSSARTLPEILQMVTGLNIYTSNLQHSMKNIDIRGIRTDFNSQILLLRDGIIINTMHTGSNIKDIMPLSTIKRIEVIRGPGSAVYGADAYSGIVNIITKDAKYLLDNSQAGIRYGSFETFEAYGNYGVELSSGVNLGLNLSYKSTDGDDDRIINSDLQSVFDGIFGTSASLAPSQFNKSFDVFELQANVDYKGLSFNLWTNFSKDMETGAGIANALDNRGLIEYTNILADVSYEYKPTQNISWQNRASYFRYVEEAKLYIFPAGTVLPVGDDGNIFTVGGGIVLFSDGYIGAPKITEDKYMFESTAIINSFENHTLRVSLGLYYTDYSIEEKKNFGPGVINGTEGVVDGTLTDVTGTPFVFMPDVDRTLFFASIQDEYTISNSWHLTAGARYDNYSDFGDTVNPRVGLVWNTSEKLTSKLLYGRAFRAPSSPETYAQNNPAGVGNKDIEAETIDMIELGFLLHPNNRLNSSLNFYYYKADDIIKSTPTTIGIQFNNIAKQTGAGVETEVTYQATDKLLLGADYAYRWTENDTTKEAVSGVAKHLAHAMLDYSITSKWFLNSEVFYTADTPREVGDTRAKIDDYVVVNLSTGYRVTDGLEAIVAVRNLFDKEYVDPSNANPVNDYPMEGFNIYAELKYRF